MNLERKSLECPFTWGISKQWACNFDEMEEPIVKFEDEPLLALLNSIMFTYTRAEKEDYKGAFISLNNTDNIWKKLVNSQLEVIEVSTQVLRHVKIATEYFVYNLTNRKIEAENTLKNVQSSKFLESFYEGTIDGCKSVAWLSFHEAGGKEAENFARLAISKSPKCPLWYYILGKSLRLTRRQVYGNFTPTDEEKNSFLTACELSDTAFYKIHVAEMYREILDYNRSQKTYLEVFRTKPTSPGILLRLAAGFMSLFDDFERAKKCLDEARKHEQNSMYHHFMGVYHAKQKKHALAAQHYELAALKGKNFKADVQYAFSLERLDKEFNLIEQLEKILVKHSDNTKYRQQIFLHIAMQYYFKKIDIANTLSYFMKAIEVHPESQQLITFFNSAVDYRTYNIYDFVSKLLQYHKGHYNKSSNLQCNLVLSKLENYCKQFGDDQLISESHEEMQICQAYSFTLLGPILRLQSYFLTLLAYINEKIKMQFKLHF